MKELRTESKFRKIFLIKTCFKILQWILLKIDKITQIKIHCKGRISKMAQNKMKTMKRSKRKKVSKINKISKMMKMVRKDKMVKRVKMVGKVMNLPMQNLQQFIRKRKTNDLLHLLLGFLRLCLLALIVLSSTLLLKIHKLP